MTDYFKLDEKAPIFMKLHDLYHSNEMNWWKKVCADKDLYVNVRKGNRIYVYYKGAAVIGELKYWKQIFSCQIHGKYIGKKDSKDYCKTLSPEAIMNDIDSIKLKIREHIVSSNEEGISEKEIQGNKYTEEKVYIDTEYAYVYANKFKTIKKKGVKKKVRLIIRIDMVTITEDGLIELVELKRISDPRLLAEELRSKPRKKVLEEKERKKEEGENPGPLEILRQMDDYKEFIEVYKDQIAEYYAKVQNIMEHIGVKNPSTHIDIKGVAPNVRLWIANYDVNKKPNQEKLERIENIYNLLKKHKISSNIEDVLSEYKKRMPNK